MADNGTLTTVLYSIKSSLEYYSNIRNLIFLLKLEQLLYMALKTSNPQLFLRSNFTAVGSQFTEPKTPMNPPKPYKTRSKAAAK